MKIVLIILSFFYWVGFTHKAGSDRVALSDDALSLREAQQIAVDSLDYAVSPIYLDSLRAVGARIHHTSRWLNGATVVMDAATAQEVGTWSFVSRVEMTAALTEQGVRSKEQGQTHPQPLTSKGGEVESQKSKVESQKSKVESQKSKVDANREQLAMIGLEQLHDAGYRGQGVTIGILDVGFPGIDTLACFRHLREEGRLKGVINLAQEERSIYDMTTGHGTMCMSILTGQLPNYTGAAPQAGCLAIKTENNDTECPIEPDNLIVGLEYCDSVGIRLVSASLGYYIFDDTRNNYTYAQLDGHTYRASQAAAIAARKGMLLCLSAGNSGNTTDWPWVAVPCDADSIITVGAVGGDSTLASFSSVGPTADGRIKPELCAWGKANCHISPTTGQLRYANGTSFACPLIAGAAACVWSAHPDETAQQIRQRLIESGHLLETPSATMGYGIPNAYIAAGSPSVTVLREHNARETRYNKVLRNGIIRLMVNGKELDLLGRPF